VLFLKPDRRSRRGLRFFYAPKVRTSSMLSGQDRYNTPLVYNLINVIKVQGYKMDLFFGKSARQYWISAGASPALQEMGLRLGSFSASFDIINLLIICF